MLGLRLVRKYMGSVGMHRRACCLEVLHKSITLVLLLMMRKEEEQRNEEKDKNKEVENVRMLAVRLVFAW